MATPLPLTFSRLKAFRTCRRKAWLAYAQGYRAVHVAWNLVFGTAMHLALEAYWKARQTGLPRDEQFARARAACDALYPPPDAHPDVARRVLYERAKLRAMVAVYVARWSTVEVEVLAVEAQFRGPFGDPDTREISTAWVREGKIDVLVRKPDGTIVVVEHKSSQSPALMGSVYRERLALDAQIDWYLVGSRFLGHPASECWYDVLVKPALRPRDATPEAKRVYVTDRKTKAQRLKANQRLEAETADAYEARVFRAIKDAPDRYFQVVPVARTTAQRLEAARDAVADAKVMADDMAKGYAPRNVEACDAGRGLCAYFPACAGRVDVKTSALFRKTENVNEELAPDQPDDQDDGPEET